MPRAVVSENCIEKALTFVMGGIMLAHEVAGGGVVAVTGAIGVGAWGFRKWLGRDSYCEEALRKAVKSVPKQFILAGDALEKDASAAVELFERRLVDLEIAAPADWAKEFGFDDRPEERISEKLVGLLGDEFRVTGLARDLALTVIGKTVIVALNECRDIQGRLSIALFNEVLLEARTASIKIEAVKLDTSEILAILRAQAPSEIKTRAIEGFLRDIGLAGLPEDQLEARFAEFIVRYRELLATADRRTNMPAHLEAERARARTAIQDSELDEAETVLARLSARHAEWRREQQEMLDQGARDEAETFAERAKLANVRFRYREAAKFYLQAAEACPRSDEEARAKYQVLAAIAFYEEGTTFGEPDALKESVRLYREAVKVYALDRSPSDWAATQHNLGVALHTIGARGVDAAVEDAICAYREALKVRTLERSPMDWAETKNNLGNALLTLGQRGNDIALNEAVSAFHEALKVFTLERSPMDWASTQNNLGEALRTMGQRGNEVALNGAVAAYHEALKVRTLERSPMEWAGTQNNLGEALRTMGQRGNDEALKDAVAAYHEALKVYTPERSPMDWAMTQNNLGIALKAMGQRGNDVALKDAVAAFREALKVYTFKRSPMDWAMTQNNLGNALMVKGERGDKAALEDALKAYRKALKVRTFERSPMDWATTQNNVGNALLTKGKRGNSTALKGAVAAYREALKIFTIERSPMDWAMTQGNLGAALVTMGERGDNVALKDAVTALSEALKVYTLERSPMDWAMTQNNLGAALSNMGARGDDSALKGAVSAFHEALKVRTFERSPMQWATTNLNLAFVEGSIAFQRKDCTRIKVALARVRAARPVLEIAPAYLRLADEVITRLTEIEARICGGKE